MKRSRFVLLLIVILMVVISALGFYRESRVGTGPRVSDRLLEGPSRLVALVANAVEGSVSLLDVEAQRVIRTLNVIPDGRRVGFFRSPLQYFGQPRVEARGGLNFAQDTDLSRDGRVLFVSRGFLADVAAFDLATGELLWRSQIPGLRADHMARSPDGQRLYVSALIRSGNRVVVLDTASGKQLGEFATGQWPHDVHLSTDGTRVYVASLGNMEQPEESRGQDSDAYLVTVHDSQTLAPLARHAFDAGIRPFVITSNESRLYAQLSNYHGLVSFDLATETLKDRIKLPVAEGVGPSDWDFEAPHHGLAMSSDERRLCIAGRASDYAAIVSTDPLALTHTVAVGNAPSWAVITPDDSYCLTANTRSDDVSFVALQGSPREIARVPVGRGAKHITLGLVPAALIAP